MTEWIVSPSMTADLPELARLVNSAYRGDTARQGWTNESALLSGQRTDPAALAEDLAGPDPSTILCLRDNGQGPILACVFLSKVVAADGRHTCYLGMLTVSPALQACGLGRALLAEAQDFARLWGCVAMQLSVISARVELIAWYERLGFVRTGETKPFPYGDRRVGEPLRQDLEFVLLDKAL